MRPPTPVPRNATELLELAENRLGWDPYESTKRGTVPVWKVRAIEAGKINRAIAKEAHVTFENLALAVDYALAHKRTITSPFGLVVMVRDAVKWDREQVQPEVVSDLESDIEAAIAIEQGRNDPDAAMWLGRFMRAVGPSRHLVYTEWREARQ